MSVELNNTEELSRVRKAKKFSLWLGIIGMFMMFAALSSGFIVYTASGVDKGIKTILPHTFVWSTVAILVSSVTLHFAHRASKVGELAKQKLLLLITVVLGILFFVLQMHSWSVLTSQQVYFINTNASQSFIYIFTGLHLAHVIAGLLVLLRCYWGAVKPITTDRNIFRMDLAAIFWHFLDLLWIYIYVFLLLNQ